jgi:general secretion pathway protein I
MSSAHEAGFSLMEILVAFAILSLSLLAIFKSYGLILRSQNATQEETLALDMARSLIAVAGTEIPLQPMSQKGQDASGIDWVREITPFHGSGRLALFRITVTVTRKDSSGRRRDLTLSTLKTAAADAQNN